LLRATLEIGLDVDCDCPKTASQSIPIGSRSITQKFPLEIKALSLDESTIMLACHFAALTRTQPASKDAILEVETVAASNLPTDRLATHMKYRAEILSEPARP
jgi:hypothetical protein